MKSKKTNKKQLTKQDLIDSTEKFLVKIQKNIEDFAKKEYIDEESFSHGIVNLVIGASTHVTLGFLLSMNTTREESLHILSLINKYCTEKIIEEKKSGLN